MPKSPSRKALPNKKPSRKGKNRDSKKAILFIFGLVVVVLLIEVFSYFQNQVNASKDIPVQAVRELSGDSMSSGPFKAWDVLATPDNRIVLSDTSQNRLLVMDDQGKLLEEIGQKQAGPPPFKEVSGLAVDSSGNIYVIDPWTGTIRGFNPKGQLILKISLDGKGFYGPRGLAWHNGNFLVADTGSHRIVQVSPSGNVEAAWGHVGSGKENFNNPVQVAVDKQGNYYVADQQNNRIQVLDSNGHFIRRIDLGAQPSSVAVDNAKNLLYVSSVDGKFVRAYTLEGGLVGTLETGTGEKKQGIQNVNALSVMPDGDILAAQTTQLTVFHPLPAPAGKS